MKIEAIAPFIFHHFSELDLCSEFKRMGEIWERVKWIASCLGFFDNGK